MDYMKYYYFLVDNYKKLVSSFYSDRCEQDIKERVLIVNQTLLDCHDRLLAELDKTVRETELAGESKVGRISFCATDLSPDNILGFLTVDGLLPSHLHQFILICIYQVLFDCEAVP